MKTFRISDFSGGLNTASAEANLPSNMSADMLDVDFTETGAITRRQGYTTVTATLGNGTALKGLYKYYKADGSAFWIGVNATAAYSQSIGLADREWGRTENTALAYNSVNATLFNQPTASAGNVHRIVTASTVTVSGIPYCNRVSIRLYSPVTGSLKVAGAASVTVASTLYTAVVSATSTHTLAYRPAARNVKAVVLNVTDTGKIGGLSTTFTANAKIYTSLRFHSDGTDPGPAYRSAGIMNSNGYQYGLVWAGSNYHLGILSSNGQFYTSIGVLATNATGWHTFELWIDGNAFYARLDSGSVSGPYYAGGTMLGQQRILISGKDSSSRSFTADTVMRATGDSITPGVTPQTATLVSDFENTAGWTDISNGTNHPTISTTTYDTAPFPWYIDYADTAVITAPTRIDANISATAQNVAFTTANDYVYMGTGYDPLKTYNGTLTATVSSTIKPEFLCTFKYRNFAVTNRYILNYTVVDSFSNWTGVGSGSINVAEKDSGSYCTGLLPWQDHLFFFGSSSIHYLTIVADPANWERKVVTRAHGCVAPKTLVDAGNSLVFLSAKAVRAYGLVEGINSEDGAATINLSRNIEPTITAIPESMLTKAAAGFYKGRYWLACSTSSLTDNDTLLVCDLDRKVKVGDNIQPVWTRYSITGLRCFVTTRGDEYGLYAGTSNGHIVQLDIGANDDGDAISLRYVTAPMAPKGFGTVKHFKALHTSVEASGAQTVTITPSTDDVDGQVAVVNVSGETDLQPSRHNISARGRHIKYTITSDGSAQPITVHSLEQAYHGERMR